MSEVNDLYEDMEKLNALYEEMMWPNDVELEMVADYQNTVSYTHLTLPTKA